LQSLPPPPSICKPPNIMLRPTAMLPAVRAATRGVPQWARAAHAATEKFQQAAMTFPKAYEKIADVNPPKPRTTGIICTIGPKSWDPEVLAELMEAGMNTIRCNMSHGDHEEQSMKVVNLMKAYEISQSLRAR